MSNLLAKRMFLSVAGRLTLILLLAVAPMGCRNEKSEQPPLSRDEMVSIMMDIYLAEARLSVLPINRDSAYRLFVPYQDSLLARRAMSDSTLRKAYSYYIQHPAELEAIYDAMIDSLSLRAQRRMGEPN